MKKIIFIAAVAATAVLASCQKSEIVNQDEPKAIGFTGYFGREATKASTTQAFNVCAYLTSDHTTSFFTSSTYTHNGTAYTTTPTRYWPVASVGNLDFFAVSPTDFTADSLITVTSDNSKHGTVDLVCVSMPNATNGQAVTLNFGHKLTKIAFKAVGADTTKTYVIDSVYMKVNHGATYHQKSGKWTDAGTLDTLNFKVTAADSLKRGRKVSKTIGETRMVIPAQAENVNLRVAYKIYEGTNLIEDNTGANGVTVEIPTTELWKANNSIVYELKLSIKSSAITFNPTITDWNTDTAKEQPVPAV